MIKIQKGDKTKSCGMVNLNLVDFVHETPSQENWKFSKQVEVPLEKCPDKNAKIRFKLSSQLISISTGSETTSVMSGLRGLDVASIDSGPNSQFKFADIDSERKDPEKNIDGQTIKVKRRSSRQPARGTKGSQVN